jgi:uncharacterized protein YecT (DUF1311 family)
MRRVVLLLLLSVIAGPALAQPVRSNACWRSAESQAQFTRCASEDARWSRERLERLLAQLHRSLESTAIPDLDRAQAAWLTYARAHCGWGGAAFDGGSLQPMIIADCMAALTEQRIATLKDYLCGWRPEDPECPAAREYDLAPGSTRRRP